jgi:hypothetical protein
VHPWPLSFRNTTIVLLSVASTPTQPPVRESDPLLGEGQRLKEHGEPSLFSFSLLSFGRAMALPVFVQDAQGTPHMPTVPPSARKLLRQGRARHVPHHAFTIICLTQPVTTPVRRSLRLDIVYHGPTVALHLILEGMPMPTLLLTVLVVPPPRSWLLRAARQRDGGRAGWSGRSRRREWHRRSGARLLPGHMMGRVLPISHLAEVVGALRALAPISQLIVTSPVAGALNDQMQRQLTAHPACAGLRLGGRAAASIHPNEAWPADTAGIALSAAPMVVAWCPTRAATAHDDQHHAASQHHSARAPIIAMTATGMTAVVAQQRPARRVLLATPHLGAGMDVVWRQQTVRRAEMRLRPADRRVVFLPIMSSLDSG